MATLGALRVTLAEEPGDGFAKPNSALEKIVDDVSMNVGQSKVSSGVSICQSFMIDSQQMQNRGVEIMHVNAVLCNTGTDIIG